VTPTEHKRGKAGFGLRTVGTWFLVAALVLCSALSVNAHRHDGEDGTSQQLFVQITEIPASGDDAGEPGGHACHCACQHFSGVILATPLLPTPGHPPALLATVADLGIPIPPSTPLRPPKA
jgi:hypothetical protein